MNEKEELRKIIDSLDAPAIIKQDLVKDYLGNHNPDSPRELKTKKMVKMSSGDGMKAAIILWEDDTITIISTDKKKEPHISSTNSPEMYYIAQKHYIDLGLQIHYAEEDGKEIGKTK